MQHILDLDSQFEALVHIFRKIKEGNTILFLGAGASVGEKRYLSKELIEYYEAYLGKCYNESNITKFLDILSADENFSRSHFDNFVVDTLKKLEVTDGHRTLARLPWREIITTNYDLLVERAYDEIESSSEKVYSLKLVRNIKQYNYRESNTEVKYVKLHGCLQDKSLYKLAFSTDDFNSLKPFYKVVLNDLRNISPDISFLSVGYSYSDAFGKELMEKFDEYNFRDKRWIINIDPFPNENALAYYSKNKICIVKASFQDFFKKYNEWEQSQNAAIVKKRGLSISDSREQYISLPQRLLINLDGIVRQLNMQTRESFIKEVDYYKGEEPNFNIITRGVDVIKRKQIEKVIQQVKDVINGSRTTIIPIFFIVGEFGIGKSTFTLRLIYELEKKQDIDIVAFEIIDFNRVKKEWLIELVEHCKAKNFVFYCDEVEITSNFQNLVELQRDLSIEQFQDCNVFFIVPIRENILEKFKLNRQISQSHLIRLDGKLEVEEIGDLLERLKNCGLINFRDVGEKKFLIKKIQKEYEADSFISLLATITGGKHENDLITSYEQLSPEAQKAFLYTALLHKHKLLMPAGWLKQNISMDWDEFATKVIKAEGKGILIQEIKTTHGTQPDLYFRTKHPLIAEKLVERFLPNKDKQYGFYDKMLRSVEPGLSSSYLTNDLLKAFVRSQEYSEYQLNKLFDSAYTKLSDDPYFLLNYSINLQTRRTKKDLKKALDLLLYAESLLEFRNHRFIHRRAVISFDLARLYYQEGSQPEQTNFYLREAKDLFHTKRLLDPFSAYSYVDYIKAIVWDLENIRHEEEDQIERMIQIEELFDLASRTVKDGIERVDNLLSLYANYLNGITNSGDYKEFLDDLYENFRLKPYACILLYNYYNFHGFQDEADAIINEIEYYQENFEVIKFLFKYYGRSLHEPNTRIKFLRLSRGNPNIEKDNPLRYNYFNFIAESYNHNFHEGRTFLWNIQVKINNLNPEYHLEWRDSEGNVQLFEARVIKNTSEKAKVIKIPSIQQTIKLMRGNYEEFVLGQEVIVKLHFYLYGIIAEIVEKADN